MLKSTDEHLLTHLLNLFNEVWKNENPPQEWKDGVIILLPQKGDPSNCNNWHGITVLSVIGKLFCSIILQWLKEAIDLRLREKQAGFRPRRSCTDNIFSLRIIMGNSLEMQAPLIINFVDFQNAFDSLNQLTLWKILQHYGIPQKFINIIKSLYEGSKCCVRTISGTIDWFSIDTRVKQGCIMSPLLFGIAIDWVLNKYTAKKQLCVQWLNNTCLNVLDRTDYVDLLSSLQHQAQEKVIKLNELAKQVGLQINTAKTQILDFTESNVEIILNGTVLEKLDHFTYLGSKFSKNR
jgi:hypothetical protein